MNQSTIRQFLILSIVLLLIGFVLLLVYAIMDRNNKKDSTKKAPPRALNIAGVVLVTAGVALTGFCSYKLFIDVKPKLR